MIILNTNLSKDDFEFASLNLKFMIQARDKNQSRNFDKHIINLAERGQVEAMELYCQRLSLNSSMNSRVVARFREIENKGRKEPRELMALSAFYKWHAYSFKHSFKDTVLDELDTYINSCKYYEEALEYLQKRKSLDPIAAEWAMTLTEKETPSFSDEQLINRSNIRNQFLTSAQRQVNESMRLKFLNAYAINLILYAPDAEYGRKVPAIMKISNDLQKSIIAGKAGLSAE